MDNLEGICCLLFWLRRTREIGRGKFTLLALVILKPFVFSVPPAESKLYIFFFILWRGVRLTPLGTTAHMDPFHHPHMINEYGAVGGMKSGR
jgi:hypothetical protein